MAETFIEIEALAGTCYKASNGQPCGLTKGFERKHRADFYRKHNRPRKLWLKTLSKNSRLSSDAALPAISPFKTCSSR